MVRSEVKDCEFKGWLKTEWSSTRDCSVSIYECCLGCCEWELVWLVCMFEHLKRTGSMAVVEKELHNFLLCLDSHSHLWFASVLTYFWYFIWHVFIWYKNWEYDDNYISIKYHQKIFFILGFYLHLSNVSVTSMSLSTSNMVDYGG